MPSLQNTSPAVRLTLVYATAFCLFFSFLSSCEVKHRRSFLPSITGYDETRSDMMVLDKALREISGMYYLEDGRIASINDEEGRIFLINLKDGSYDSVKFAGKGDYEDLVKVDSLFYVVESNGDIHIVDLNNPQGRKQVKFPRKKIEFESLYYRKDQQKLVLISKDHSEKQPGILAYSFDLATRQFSSTPYFFIPMKQVFFAAKNNIAECKPSAAAIQPVTNRLYIIASIGKLLLECKLDGRVLKAFKINPAQFPQPEGITFAPNGDMYISNEGLNGKATIFKFPYSK
jgi:hypothetical protein